MLAPVDVSLRTSPAPTSGSFAANRAGKVSPSRRRRCSATNGMRRAPTPTDGSTNCARTSISITRYATHQHCLERQEVHGTRET